jgi:hypothetical protein
MKVSQRNSLHSYLKQEKKAISFFFLLQNQKAGEQKRPRLGGGVDAIKRRKEMKKCVRV